MERTGWSLTHHLELELSNTPAIRGMSKCRMSRGAAEESFTAPRLIPPPNLQSTACRPRLHSFAANAAKTGCVKYVEALTRRAIGPAQTRASLLPATSRGDS